jgi:hypothetical protein
MTEAMRRKFIVEDLRFSVQQGKLTQRDRFLILWHLKAGGDWTLQRNEIPSELKAKALAASPTLANTPCTTT